MKLFIENSQETKDLAHFFADFLQPKDILLLFGDLGAGKTFFARSLIQFLMGTDIEVPSPTFTLVQQYDTPKGNLYHMDLYRLKTPEEIVELGIEEAFATGVCLIEWPERLGPYKPKNCIELHFDFGDNENKRILNISFIGDLQRTTKRIFAEKYL